MPLNEPGRMVEPPVWAVAAQGLVSTVRHGSRAHEARHAVQLRGAQLLAKFERTSERDGALEVANNGTGTRG